MSKDIPLKKKKILYRNEQRRIINPDAQTCWLNSCLQLVLTALDHKDNIEDFTTYGSASVLWDQLIWFKGSFCRFRSNRYKKCANTKRKRKNK